MAIARPGSWIHALALLATLAPLALACGGDKDEKMERGLVVDDEVAAPTSEQQMDMTDDERARERIEQDAN